MRDDLARAGARFFEALPRGTMTQAIGWLSERTIPRALRPPVLGGLARAFGIDLGEAERPLESYPTFQALFSRRLGPGLRPCTAEEHAVVSPVDGRFVDSGPVAPDATFRVKGIAYSASRLLGDEPALVDRFLGGHYGIFYLSPRDYHRMHSPITGRVAGYRWLPGEHWPVNALVPWLPDVYCENERVVTVLEGAAGAVAMVKVAALGVGYISLAYLGEEAGVRVARAARPPRRDFEASAGPRLRRGDEIAAFGLGSTVILLFEPGRIRLHAPGGGQVVRVGEPLGEQLAAAPPERG